MPSRRELIEMSPEEIRLYLQTQRHVVVVTNGTNGLPHPMPMHYGLDEQERVVITTFVKSQKVRNLIRDPRATLLVESGSAYRELKSVIMYCSAELKLEPEEIVRLMPLVRASDEMAASLDASMNEQIRRSLTKRAAICFTPFKTISWDHSKLDEFY